MRIILTSTLKIAEHWFPAPFGNFFYQTAYAIVVMTMHKRFFQVCTLILLCTLLVFAPEILTAVSPPYRVSTPERTLLRVVLCTEDEDAAASFYKALAPFRKENSSVHLRITRADTDQLLSLTQPLPDVYLFPASLSVAPESLFLSLDVMPDSASPSAGVWNGVRYARPYVPDKGETLLCAIGAQAESPGAASAFMSALCTEDASP